MLVRDRPRKPAVLRPFINDSAGVIAVAFALLGGMVGRHDATKAVANLADEQTGLVGMDSIHMIVAVLTQQGRDTSEKVDIDFDSRKREI